MLDIIIGITDLQLAESRALASVPKSGAWFDRYEITNAPTLYDLRKQSCTNGLNEWITFVDQDDTIVDINRYRDAILTKGTTGAVFANSVVIVSNGRYPMFDSAMQFSTATMKSGIVPHHPLIMKRSIAAAAIDAAYNRILKSDTRFLDLVDLALTYEIQLTTGWQYYPQVAYNWYNTSSAAHHNDPSVALARIELATYYKNLLP